MPTAVKDQLWRLIKSLNKAEKRNFKLYATRAGSTGDSKFIQLFDVLDRLGDPDDSAVTDRLKLTPGQYSNLKRHLYQQVLTSLRLIYINKEIDIELREQIDFSHILYGKGLYLDALRSLERAKSKAVEHNRDVLHLEILEFQKLIESRHVTLSRQIDNKMDLLLNESAERSYSVLNTSELFNLNIQIHGRYIEVGHSRSERERQENVEYWNSIQTYRFDRETVSSTFHQKINRFQASMWYHYIQLSFDDALESAMNALTLFHLSTHMTVKDPDLYLRCLYYVSIFAYLTGDTPRMLRSLRVVQEFLGDDQVLLNENSQLIGRTYAGLMSLNAHLATANWTGAQRTGQQLRSAYSKKEFRPTDHRWGLFLYKFAATCFILRRFDEALDYLNEIINMRSGILREDLLLNTRLLHLICHFELGNRALLDYHLVNVNRQMRKSPDTGQVHRLATSALRKLIKLADAEHPAVFEKLDEDLRAAATTDPYEHKALLYLDLTHWVRLHLPTAEPSAPQQSSAPDQPYGVSPSAPTA
ncbi:hypothetical protein [Neolewinella litorea]|uniref:Tetratricopeptide repeat protein n=1 Tax=Neolewinella litorea TaxID=2562452 RepID=A0A4V3XJZ8_9BACT|nr:hypothetical protein [Neolewinella litorea]THH35013.1 hypothetical protein E4021_16995 [Neolewinella litorea]